jgi:hypothetical protein
MVFLQDFQSYFLFCEKIALKILYLNRKKSENLFLLHVWRNGKFRRILPRRILRNFPFLQSYFFTKQKIALKILYLNRKKSENLFLLHIWVTAFKLFLRSEATQTVDGYTGKK